MSKYLKSLILLSVISMGVSAQRITRQYNNVSFSAALKDLNARQDSMSSTLCMTSWRISR